MGLVIRRFEGGERGAAMRRYFTYLVTSEELIALAGAGHRGTG